MHLYRGYERAKRLDLFRDCLPFRICACGKPLWSAKAFGNHQPDGLPFRNPVVGCRSPRLYNTLRCMYRVPTHGLAPILMVAGIIKSAAEKKKSL